MIGDKRALKQMLFNLLSNAIKFTERGGRVSVCAAVEDAQLALVVEDTGVGISEADLPRLGDPFFQARSSYDRPYEGTGLGLSIVKGLVDLHGGRFEVTSRLGIGTRATIRLPLDCEASRERQPKIVDFGQAARHPLPTAPALSDVAETEMKKRA
jgi:cell cycle sensor histidine kinase DivJ